MNSNYTNYFWFVMAILIYAVNTTSYEYFPECQANNYKLLDDSWRFHENTKNKYDSVASKDDTSLEPGWYRFSNKATRLIEKKELHHLKTFDRHTFAPCGSQVFDEVIFPTPGRILLHTTPIFVLNGTHPNIVGEFAEINAMECSYSSILKMMFGDDPISEAVCKMVNRHLVCKFEAKCSSVALPVKVRHCGEYYVYHLETLPQFNISNLANHYPPNLKNGAYCGVNKETIPEPSLPCACQATTGYPNHLKNTQCNINYTGKDAQTIYSIYRCLWSEVRAVRKLFTKFEKCSLKMETLMGSDPEFASDQYPVPSLKAGVENCKTQRRQVLESASVYAFALEKRFASLVHSKDLTGTPISNSQLKYMSSPTLLTGEEQWEAEYTRLYGLDDYFEFN